MKDHRCSTPACPYPTTGKNNTLCRRCQVEAQQEHSQSYSTLAPIQHQLPTHNRRTRQSWLQNNADGKEAHSDPTR